MTTHIMRELQVGVVYRVTFSYGYGPNGKRRTLGRIVGRCTMAENENGHVAFRTNKRETHHINVSSLVSVRYVEEGDK